MVEHWAVGTTLRTRQTESWSDAEIAENNLRESRLVFSGFSASDEGRSRRLIANCASPADARLIALAPQMLALLKAINEEAIDTGRHCETIDNLLLRAECP